MAGKGSRPRPYSVDLNTFDNNWDNIFGNKKVQVRATENTIQFGSCGCGRSPSGDCCGWHNLSQEEYLVKLDEFNAAQNTKDSNQGG